MAFTNFDEMHLAQSGFGYGHWELVLAADWAAQAGLGWVGMNGVDTVDGINDS